MIETIWILILSTEKSKWLNFLRDSVLIASEHIDKKQKFHEVTHMKMIHMYKPG